MIELLKEDTDITTIFNIVEEAVKSGEAYNESMGVLDFYNDLK